MTETQASGQAQQGQIIIINQEKSASNGIGTAGFVMALIGLFLSWVPVLGWIIWFLGVVFSFVGVFRTPKGLSIAGLVISFIGLIILSIVVAGITALAL